MCSAGFPEPYTFSLRVAPAARAAPRRLRPRPRQPVPRHRPARDDGRRLAGARHAAPPDHRRPRPRPRARHERVAPLHAAPLVRLPRHADEGRARDARASSRCRSRASATSCAQMGVAPDRLHIVPVGVDPDDLPPDARDRARARAADDHHERRRADEGPRRRCSRRWPRCAPSATTPSSWSSASPRRKSTIPAHHRAPRAHRRGAVRVAASPTSASSSSTPRPRSRSCRRSTRASRSPRSRRWRAACRSSPPPAARCPRSSAPTARPALLVPPGDPDALAAHAAARRSATPTCAPASARPAARRVLDQLHLAPDRGRHGRAYYLRCSTRTRRRRRRPGVADADRRLRPARPARRATACSTSAAAAAATRSRRCAAARRVVALDYDAGELKDVRAVRGRDDRSGRDRRRRARRRGQRRRAAPAVPRRHLRPHHRSEVLEHIWDDERAIAELVRVLRPGGRLAVTVPDPLARARVSWAINDRLPRHARRPRAHLPPARARAEARAAGLWLRGSHHAHALHSPYWWLKCAFGLDNTDAWPVQQVPRLPRLPDRAAAPSGLGHRRPRAQPGARQEPRRLHAEGRLLIVSPASTRSPTSPASSPRPSCSRRSTRSRRSSCPTATSRGSPAATPTRGTSSKPRWRSTSAAATTKPRAAYDWLARHAARRRRLARVLPRRRRRGPHARHQRHLLRRDRRVAPLPRHRRHRVPRGSCGRRSKPRSTSRSTSSTRPARSRGAATTPTTARCSPDRRASTISLQCAIAIAERLGHERPDWELSLGSLAIAIAHRPDVFLDKDRWAMDWYYPILGGVLRGYPANARDRRRAGRRSWSKAAACAACPTARGSPRPRRASW